MPNLTKADRIRELLPALLNTKQDVNWSGLIDAIGQQDDKLATLIQEVRDQFFIKTASRPYIDRLAANSNITRPRFVGMGDATFRKYVPILSYQPKQVKLIIDQLLEIFFFEEATTAFLSSANNSPFTLEDGWSLQLNVDNINQENIKFSAADFSSISAATADEIVAAYNRQALYSYAINYFDSITKHNYIRIFTNTIGNQGSLSILGGLANIGIQLNGFISTAGNGTNTQWSVTKVGNNVTFTYTGGALPGLDQLQVGDLFLCDLPGNKGSFLILNINIQNSSFTFVNLLGTPGSITQTSALQTKYLRPETYAPYKLPRRALTWETVPGQITVEMPATPSVVERNLAGGFHINGVSSVMTAYDSTTSLTVTDASKFPAAGQFVVQPVEAITARLLGNNTSVVATTTSNGQLISELTRYSYTSISGNTLLGITPNLPIISSLHEVTITSMSRTSGVVTCIVANDYEVGQNVIIRNSSGIPILMTTADITSGSSQLDNVASIVGLSPGQLILGSNIAPGTQILSVITPNTVIMTQAATGSATGQSVTFSENTNGTFPITSVSSSQFTFNLLGVNGSVGTPGTACIEEVEFAATNSLIIVTSAISSSTTKIVGPYIWDPKATFVLSSNTATIEDKIIAGKTVNLLNISTNTIPNQLGFVVFDYGLNTQEGPVRYLYMADSTVMVLDPSYTFQQNHAIGSSIIAIAHKGPHIMSETAAEFSPYITNPPDARVILQNLISSVTSAGIFIDFLIRYPIQLYGTLSVYD